jgi:hypothetical protein
MKQNEKARESIQTGKLTLTSAAQIQRFIQAERKVADQPVTPDRATELIQTCSGKSKREVEKTLFAEASPQTQTAMRERSKIINECELEIKMTLSPATQAKLNRARELIHTDTMAEVFERALEALIAEKEKALGKTKRTETSKTSTPPVEEQNQPLQKTYQNPRHIPTQFKRIIYERSKGQCEYINSNKTRCPSRTLLEIDHVNPLALGGKTIITNQQHLCRNHNQYRARATFD